MLSVSEWHQRFVYQARWTAQMRRFVNEGLGLTQARRGLEVGCGTGVATPEMGRQGATRLYGIDIRADFLQAARKAGTGVRLAQSDALSLPFKDSIFDFTFCHYLLLWVSDPAAILREMRRVTRPGGPVIALAEPDYGGRIDYPASLAKIGRQQGAALRAQGANPETGRHLGAYMQSAGLKNVRTAVMGNQWGEPLSPEVLEAEWQMLVSDLAGSVPATELAAYKQQNTLAWQSGERILYIPNFYAWGFA